MWSYKFLKSLFCNSLMATPKMVLLNWPLHTAATAKRGQESWKKVNPSTSGSAEWVLSFFPLHSTMKLNNSNLLTNFSKNWMALNNNPPSLLPAFMNIFCLKRPKGGSNHSRSKQRTDQRVLVLTLKFLALKKICFNPVKNTSKIFFDFCLPLLYATFQCGP